MECCKTTVAGNLCRETEPVSLSSAGTSRKLAQGSVQGVALAAQAGDFSNVGFSTWAQQSHIQETPGRQSDRRAQEQALLGHRTGLPRWDAQGGVGSIVCAPVPNSYKVGIHPSIHDAPAFNPWLNRENPLGRHD